MKSRKKNLVSGLAIVVIIACVLLIASTLSANLLFPNRQATPHLFGYDMYLNTETQMVPIISETSAIRLQTPDSYMVGDVVLYEGTSGALHISRIARLDTAPAEEGAALTLDVINALGQSEALTMDNLQGRCVDENVALGKVLLFMTDKWGIILLIVAPCVFLLIYCISRFIAAAEDDDEPQQEEDGLKRMGRGKQPKAPLFRPEEAARKDQEFQEKKAELAEHFSQKSAEKGKFAKKKKQQEFELESGRRALEETVNARRKERAAVNKKMEQSRYNEDEDELEPRADLDERVAAIKQAMEQKAQERREQEAEQERLLAQSKVRSAEKAAEKAATVKPEAEEAPVKHYTPRHEAEETETPAPPAFRQAVQAAEQRTERTERPAEQRTASRPAPEPQPAERPVEAHQAAPTQRRPAALSRPATRRPMPAPRSSAKSGNDAFEELMAKLDEEKKKLNAPR